MEEEIKKEDIIFGLKELICLIENSDRIDGYNVKVFNELEEICRGKEYGPTGWTNIDLSRLYKGDKDNG